MPDPVSIDVVLPEDSVAEKAVLGALLQEPSALARVRYLRAEDFFRPIHREIYRSIQALAARGLDVDPFTVQSEVKSRGGSTDALRHIARLLDGVPRATHVETYAASIIEMAGRRALMGQLERARDSVSTADLDTLAAYVRDVNEIAQGVLAPRLIRAVNIFDPRITPTTPQFTVPGLIRRSGLHLVWAPPAGGKTWTLLRWMVELMAWDLLGGQRTLSDHPDLVVKNGYAKVLWIGTEEDTGSMRAKIDLVMLGLGIDRLPGEFCHLWAAGPRRRVTLDDLPDLLDATGPLDAVVLDSLTGLRPKLVNGERVRWDVDNDAANELCLGLRGLAKTHDVAMFLIHHTGRIVEKGYRGPTDWWASADVMFGLMPEQGKTKVLPEKNRDGKLLEPFYLVSEWGPDGFSLKYDGVAKRKTLTVSAVKIDAFLVGRGEVSQAAIIKSIGLSRSTVQRGLGECVEAGLVRDTGKKANGSPIYMKCSEEVPPEPAG